VLSGLADYSAQSGQPATKHILIEVDLSSAGRPGEPGER
jgi:hypothetical protein